MEASPWPRRPTRPASRRLAKLRADLADEDEQPRGLRARWDQEKAGLDRVGDLKIQIDELRMAATGPSARATSRPPHASSTASCPHSSHSW